MSEINLVYRNGKLAVTTQYVLRVSGRDNFFDLASNVAPAQWPGWRDEVISRILDGLNWLDLWNSPDGEYTVPQSEGFLVLSKRGDVVSLVAISANDDISDARQWRRGTPCPFALTFAEIAKRWDERINEKRRNTQ